MKNMDDSEIQRLLDANLPIDNLPDVKLYERVYKELNKEPDLNLGSLSFDTIAAIQSKKDWAEFYTSAIIVLLCVFVGATTFFLVAGSINDSMLKQVISLLSYYKVTLTYVAATIIIIHILDRKLIKPRISTN